MRIRFLAVMQIVLSLVLAACVPISPVPGISRHVAPDAARTARLPAPLYYYDLVTEQITRLETDGLTKRPISPPNVAVYSYGVSPADGSVAYVTKDGIMLTDPLVINHTKLIDSLDAPAGGFTSPIFSPDGKHIAVGRGVILVPVDPDLPHHVLWEPKVGEAKTLHEKSMFGSGMPALASLPRFVFWPMSWSPDGRLLLMGYQDEYNLEFLGTVILNIETGNTIYLASPTWTDLFIGDIAWAEDSSHFFISRYDRRQVPYGGLVRVEVADGAVTDVIPATEDYYDATAVRSPFVRESELLAFVEPHADLFEAELAGLFRGPTDEGIKGAIYRINPQDGSLTLLSSEDKPFYLDKAPVWAPDGSGALVLNWDLRKENINGEGNVAWVSADDGTLTPLPIYSGDMPRWGR